MALPKIVTDAVAVSGTYTLTLLDVIGLEVGYPIVVSGVNANYDGEHTITAINTTNKTVTWTDGAASHTTVEVVGQLYVPVTWATEADVETFLGAAPDADWLAFCTEAANEFCWNRRRSSGYCTDLPDAVPNPSVHLAVILYGGAAYREKGSVDSFASFTEIPIQPPVGSMGRIKQLLGVERPAIA